MKKAKKKKKKRTVGEEKQRVRGKVSVLVYIPETLWLKAKTLAFVYGESYSDFVTRALKEYVKMQEEARGKDWIELVQSRLGE